MQPFKSRSIDPTKPVDVYRCLNRKGKVYSIRQNGLVVAHTERLILTGCTFIVNPGGKRRAIESQERNVHAYVRGMITEERPKGAKLNLKYNPYNERGFYNDLVGEVSGAQWVLIQGGRVLMFRPNK